MSSNAQYQWPQGNTHDQLTVSLVQGDGSNFDLTGVPTAAISLRKRGVNGGYVGNWTALSGSVQQIASPPTNGTFTYKFASADVAAVGLFDLEVIINYGGTADQMVTFPERLEIISA